MEYQTKIRFSGDAARAIQFGVETLAGHGFRIVRRDGHSAELAGPGMRSTKQSPLLGASRIEIRGGRGGLFLEAELGALRLLLRLIGFFLLAMALGFAVLFGILFRDRGLVEILLLSVAPFALWPALLPWMGVALRRRSRAALDVLLDGMAAMGKNGPR